MPPRAATRETPEALRERLTYFEDIYRECESALWEGAEALYHIHEEKLYLHSEHGPFKYWSEYLKAIWPKSWQRAEQLISWVKVVLILKKSSKENRRQANSPMPTEQQARAMNGVPDKDKPTVWAKVVNEGPPTTAKVKSAAEQMKGAAKVDRKGLIEDSEDADAEECRVMALRLKGQKWLGVLEKVRKQAKKLDRKVFLRAIEAEMERVPGDFEMEDEDD